MYPNEPSSHIPALTGLRAIAAGWVVAHHFERELLTLLPVLGPLRPVLDVGWLGVEVFFVLSGFVLAHTYAGQLASGDASARRRFWWARVARVYPVHLATLVVLAVFAVGTMVRGGSLPADGRYSPVTFAGNLVMLQALPGMRGVQTPAWSVACEAAAYLAFPLLAVWLAKLSGRMALGGVAILAAIGVVGPFVLFMLSGSFSSLSHPMMWLRIAVEFPMGALLWVWWSRRVRVGMVWDAVAFSALAAVVAWAYVTVPESPSTFIAGPLLAMFVVACASATGPLGRCLSSRPMLWGGRISYSLYMTHFLLLIALTQVVPWSHVGLWPWPGRVAVAVCLVAILLGLAAATYLVVEEPGRRIVRRITAKQATESVLN